MWALADVTMESGAFMTEPADGILGLAYPSISQLHSVRQRVNLGKMPETREKS